LRVGKFRPRHQITRAVEGKMRMFDWRKSSGVDAPREKISFFSPRPSKVF
jgi:hypothetical protein